MDKKVVFTNSRGDRLAGIIRNPSADKTSLFLRNKAQPIIILAHGFSSHKNSRTYLQLADALVKHHISTFRFDFYGHGESQGKFADITMINRENNPSLQPPRLNL